jgi:hypothetical protein
LNGVAHERKPLDDVDLLLDLRTGQAVELGVVALELGKELVSALVLLVKNNDLAAIVTNSQIFSAWIEG